MPTDFPSRGQQAPLYWDTQLKAWIEETPITAGNFLTNLIEAVQDILGGSLISGTGITVSYDDPSGHTTVSSTGLDSEAVRDAIGVALVQGSGITITVDDPGNTITIGVDDGALTIAKTSGLQSAIDSKADASHTHPATGISDSTAIGRSVLTAVDAPTIRAAIGVVPAPIRFSAETPTTGTTGTDRAAVARTLVQARMRVGSAPVGSDLVVVVQHSAAGSGTWSTVATLTITAGSTTEAVSGTLSQAQAVGDLVRLNVTGVGSTTPAADVVVDVVVS